MYLNCHSYYSFRFGIMSLRDLLGEAKKYGISALALTDINNTSEVLTFIRMAPDYGIRPVVGIDFKNLNKIVNFQSSPFDCFVTLAKNNKGFQALNTFLSHHRHRDIPFPGQAPQWEDVFVIYPYESFKGHRLRENEFLGVRPKDINKVRFTSWWGRPDKLVALQPVTFRNKRDFNAHRLLRAIDNNTLLSKLPKSQEAPATDCFLSPDQMRWAYADCPHLLKNAEKLLGKCSIEFEFGTDKPPKNRKFYTGSAGEDWNLIHRLCEKGLEYRYPKVTDQIRQRLNMELDIIKKKNFITYFLINWDIVSYARRKNYFYVGRGSGANSIVAYLLRITDVDPIELDLYFERFINLYRTNPPDFDIDFSWKDREDVTRYIFKTFHPKHTALIGSYVTFKHRAVVRQLGKVFGLPKHEMDKLSKGDYQFQSLDHLSQLVLRYGKYIEGFPSHLSVHAGGIVIAEQPINHFTATDLPPKGFPTTHFDMYVAEDAGLYKFDILGQRGLAKIKDAISLVEQNHVGRLKIDIHNIQRFKQDEAVKKLLRNGMAIGCFYVESPAMRMLLRKLRVEDYLGLVAASSVIRPGVAQSGMMREYIMRYRFPEKRKEAPPVLLNIMPDTFGVMVYQEDVIKVAHYFAGLSLAEADVLRRGMSGKFRSRKEFKKVQVKFFDNCRERGITDALAKEVWRQIESFGGYAFAKGHSASFAVESFQSLFLKAHYPLEYIVATVNNGGGFYSRELYFHEARMHGGRVHEPCINRSDTLTVIHGKDIWPGLDFVQGLEQRIINHILESRKQHGPFTGLYNFLERIPVSMEQLILLIRINAFRFTKRSKKALLWDAHFLMSSKENQPHRDLFCEPPKEYRLPPLNAEPYEEAFDQMELLGFPLCDPFELMQQPVGKVITASSLPHYKNKVITTYGYLVTVKYVRTVTGENMNFGTFLDKEGHWIDTVHFPDVAKPVPFWGKGIYKITGKVVEEFDFYTIEVTHMERMPFIEDPRYSDNQVLQKVRKAG